jgi:DNA-binding response OmpR family regulator
MTGCSTDRIPAVTSDLQVHAVLQKPFRPEELISMVNDLLSGESPTVTDPIETVKP